MSGFHGMDFDERIKPFAQQVALLDAQRMDEIRSLRQQLEGAVEALDEAIKAARLFNRNGMTWLEYDRRLVELEQVVNRARGQ